MSFHHVAITTKDLAATHRFYTEAVGFVLAKVDVVDNPFGGWMRHALYDTGDESVLAVLEFNDHSMGEYRTDISSGLACPIQACHAFPARMTWTSSTRLPPSALGVTVTDVS